MKNTADYFEKIKKSKFVDFCIAGVLASVVLPLVLSVAATKYWVFDLFAQYYVQYFFLLGIATCICLLLNRWKPAAIFALATVISLIPVADYLPFTPNDLQIKPSVAETLPEDTHLRVLSFNVLAFNTEYPKTLEYIATEDPDIVLLYEAGDTWQKKLPVLEKKYPHTECASQFATFGICIFSKNPWDTLTVERLGPLELVTINATYTIGGQPTQIVGVHPIPPLGADKAAARNAHLMEAAALFDTNSSRILAGDFNLTPYSPWFKKVANEAQVVDVAKGSGLRNTWKVFPTPLGGLRIDHLLISQDIGLLNYKIGPDLGSDHRPIVVDLIIQDALTF